jgi:tyrosyl-tRNA synthetase
MDRDAAIETVLSRRVNQVVEAEALRAMLRGDRPLRVKLGIDPTSPDLHIGHAVVLERIRAFQDLGHTAVLVVGDTTAQIGDPSEKNATRPMLSREEVRANADTYLAQFHLVVDQARTEVRWQSEWFDEFRLREVFALMSRFTLARMIERDTFAKRLAEGAPVSMHETMYPLLQAYDSVAIESDVEVGGTDQLFNILAGRELQEQVGQRPQNLLINHLLEGLDGLQMSKSKPKTAIWLTDPPSEIYGKVMSIEDKLMPHYFEWATEMPRKEVNKILGAIGNRELHPKEAKEKLAWQITSELHSPAAADEAKVAFGKQFKEGGLPDDIPTVDVEVNGHTEINIVDLLRDTKIATSRSDALRLVKQGGVKVDGSKASLETMVPTTTETVIQVGPRKHYRIRWR